MTRMLVFACALFVAAGIALADDAPAKKKGDRPKPTPEQVFKKLDTNSDGYLSEAEFIAKKKDQDKAKEMFAKRDKNKDGKICIVEFSPAKKDGAKGEGKKKQKQEQKAPEQK